MASTTGLSEDTIVAYKTDDGNRTLITMQNMLALAQAVDKPVIVYSLTTSKRVQESKGVDVSIRIRSSEAYYITLSNGYVVKCEASTRFAVTGVTSKLLGVSAITGMTYLSAANLSIDDKIIADNQVGYLEVTAITIAEVDYPPFYSVSVPMFGNFFMHTQSSEGVETNIVVIN